MTKILQLKIKLNGIKPYIWRRFLVEDKISFHKLHEIIQIVISWENYNLYEFNVNGLEVGMPDEDYSEDIQDSKTIKFSEVLKKEKQKFHYLYDFGDSWEHIIVVEKILEKYPQKCPVCIAGERTCPPEDCGGDWGYEELLKIRKNKNHPEYKEKIVGWLGKDFDPEHFDINKVNKSLVICK